MTARKIITLALTAAALAGCGTAASQAPAQTDTTTTCTFGATGSDVQVQFAKDATPCSQQEANLATDGQSWYPVASLTPAGGAGSADGEAMAAVCTLTKDGSYLYVDDAGTASYGTTICSGEEQGGWTTP